MLPEGVIHGKVEPCYPVGAVGGFRFGSDGGEPPEVGHDVAVGLEDLPVGGVVSAYDGGVVLGLQPCPALVGGDALDIATELGKRLEAAVGREEFGRHLLLEGMHLEGRKDLVGVAERGEERLVVGRHGLGLEQAVDGSLVDMRENFASMDDMVTSFKGGHYPELG